MRVALVTLDIAWEDPETNHRRAGERLREAAAAGARLAILPEMFATGFSMDAAKVAEAEGGPTETWLRDAAASTGLHVLAGVAQIGPDGGKPENRALLASPSGRVERTPKLHPFSSANEHLSYRGGDRVATWDVEGIRVTPLVCYDLRFPEPFRVATDDTDLYAVIANWPDRRREHWRTLLRARAIENLAYVAGVNRAGEGDGLRYPGDSALVGPWGETIVEGGPQETVLVADVDAAAVREARASFPPLRDRRPEAYRR